MDYVVVVAIITGVVQLLKKTGTLSEKLQPIVPVFLGLVGGFLFVDGDIGTRLFLGIGFGLASMGLFDLSKVNKKTKEIK